MPHEPCLRQWTSSKHTGNDFTERGNTVEIHNHSIIKKSCSNEKENVKEKEKKAWIESVQQCKVVIHFSISIKLKELPCKSLLVSLSIFFAKTASEDKKIVLLPSQPDQKIDILLG